MDGCFPDVKGLGQYVMLGDAGGELEFTVVNVTLRIIKSDQSLLDDVGKGASPQHGLHRTIEMGHKVNAAHTGGRRTLGAQSIWFVLGYDFSDAGGSTSQIRCDPSKVCKY
jgi:hypothetical protein